MLTSGAPALRDARSPLEGQILTVWRCTPQPRRSGAASTARSGCATRAQWTPRRLICALTQEHHALTQEHHRVVIARGPIRSPCRRSWVWLRAKMSPRWPRVSARREARPGGRRPDGASPSLPSWSGKDAGRHLRQSSQQTGPPVGEPHLGERVGSTGGYVSLISSAAVPPCNARPAVPVQSQVRHDARATPPASRSTKGATRRSSPLQRIVRHVPAGEGS
jgi:hypothetical protein